jgi:hypothetical protein
MQYEVNFSNAPSNYQDLQINPSKLVSVLNFDGTPITAENILRQVSNKFKSDQHLPKSKVT